MKRLPKLSNSLSVSTSVLISGLMSHCLCTAQVMTNQTYVLRSKSNNLIISNNFQLSICLKTLMSFNKECTISGT